MPCTPTTVGSTEMEAYQHAGRRSSVPSSSESMSVRAASTAYSGHIDRHGRWRAVAARDEDRAIIVEPTLRPACSVYLVLVTGRSGSSARAC